MGRRKITITPIADERNRSVTFNKRRAGLFKKAYELGVLCSADIAVIVFSPNGKCYEYSSGNLDETLLRYSRMTTAPTERKGPADFGGSAAATSTKAGPAADDDEDEEDSESEKAVAQPKPTPPPDQYDFSHGLTQLPIAPGYGHGAFAPYFQPNIAYPAFPGFYNPYQQHPPITAPAADAVTAPAIPQLAAPSPNRNRSGSNGQADARLAAAHANGAMPYHPSLHPSTSGGYEPGFVAPDYYAYPPGRLSAAVTAGMEEFTWPTYERTKRDPPPLQSPVEQSVPLATPTTSIQAPISRERKRKSSEEDDYDPTADANGDEGSKRRR